MNYQVLARKWRPQKFSDVVGQEHVLNVLSSSLLLGRVHHAYFFSGIHGVGKTSIARLLTKSLNCKTGITTTPCEICSNCQEIKQGLFVDLIEVDAASKTKVEDIRELLDSVHYLPVHGRFKVYLIDEVHMLSRYSFNGLLNILEEPPSHVKFLLATTDPQKVPITVLSRCLQLHLKVLDVDQIFQQIKFILDEEKITYELHAIRLLARAANGSLRDALNLTDQVIANKQNKLSVESVSIMLGILGNDQVLSLIESIVAADSKKVMNLINQAASNGVEWETFLIEVQSLLHRIAMIQFSANMFIGEAPDVEHRMYKLARIILPTDLQLYYQIVLIGRKELPFAPDKRMGVEMTMLRALAFHPQIPFQQKQTIFKATKQVLSAQKEINIVQQKNESNQNESTVLNKTQIVNRFTNLDPTLIAKQVEYSSFSNLKSMTNVKKK